jgi:hypothetical protein
MNWMLFWKITLILTLSCYSLLVIIVIIGGMRNVVQMLRELREPPDPSSED